MYTTSKILLQQVFSKPLLLAAVAGMMLFHSCKKEDVQTKREAERVKFPVGVENGMRVTKTIGANGGSLQSGDGKIKVTIPAGAVAANTEFSIQPLTSTLPGSIDKTYRLLPEGVALQKPAVIEFSYAGLDLRGTTTDLLYPAYQDKDGYYHMLPEPTRNAGNQTVQTETKYMSDWTIFAYVRVDPKSAVIAPGATTEFTLTQTVLADIDPVTGNSSIAEPETYHLPDKVQWSKSAGGIGGILVSGGAECAYTAPQTTGVQFINCTVNGIAIRGKQTGQIQILAEVQVVDDPLAQNGPEDSFIHLEIDGKPYEFGLISGTFNTDRTYIAATVDPNHNYDPQQLEINLFAPATINTEYRYDYATVPNKAELIFGPGFLGNHNMRTDYIDCSGTKIVSGGSLKFTKVGPVGDFVEGNFTCTGYGDMLRQCPSPNRPAVVATIKGRFKIYRAF